MIKLLNLLIENSDNIIVPFNVYYIESDNKLRDIGLDGVVTEPELMRALWNEYQNMKGFTTSLNSGGDKYTNMMQDIGFNMDIKTDEDKMFYGEFLPQIINKIELYVPQGIKATKDINSDDYWPDEERFSENNFSYSQQQADKYKYDLIDDDEFREFVDELKQLI